MNYQLLNDVQMEQAVGGEPITLATIVVLGTTAIIIVAMYKLYQSKKGNVKLPGGFAFEWLL